jgi:hypothetical protein
MATSPWRSASTFSRYINDILGSSTDVTVNNWFSSSANQLHEIVVGGLKLDSQVSQLVQAMATYSVNNPAFDPTSSDNSTLPNDASLQNAVAATSLDGRDSQIDCLQARS